MYMYLTHNIQDSSETKIWGQYEVLATISPNLILKVLDQIQILLRMECRPFSLEAPLNKHRVRSSVSNLTLTLLNRVEDLCECLMKPIILPSWGLFTFCRRGHSQSPFSQSPFRPDCQTLKIEPSICLKTIFNHTLGLLLSRNWRGREVLDLQSTPYNFLEQKDCWSGINRDLCHLYRIMWLSSVCIPSRGSDTQSLILKMFPKWLFIAPPRPPFL
jgi:hypothetical protein